VPETVENIGFGAFAGNTNLNEISLPANLKEISGSLFLNCSNLTTVELPEGIEKIGYNAFYNCISLQKIKVPDSVQTIESNAFSLCYKLSDVSLGSQLNKIENNAFYKNYSLKKISFPRKLKMIEDAAFSRCVDLTKVTFANSDTKLGTSVFSYCKSLVTAVLPANIKAIPEFTFSNCENLEKVTFPKNVSIIKKSAFMGCTSLEKIRLNKKIYAISDQAFAESGLKKVTLNKKLQFLGNATFRGTQIKSLKLYNKVTYIGNRLFSDCTKLKTISIPASVKGINPGAFRNCTSLRAINVDAENQNYSSLNGVLYNKDKTKLIQYPLHKTSKAFVTPETVRTIRANAFAKNKYLQSVVIKAKKIGNNAFSDMPKLKSAVIQDGTVVIWVEAFANDSNLKKIEIPDSVSQIKMGAFQNTGIKEMHIPSSLKELGSNVFSGCNKLVTFTGGKTASYRVKDGVLYNRKKTVLIKYPAKKETTSFVVPNSVQRIRSEAFDHVTKLVKLEFGAKLTSIGYHGIYKAKKLKSITFNTKTDYTGRSYARISDCERLAVIVGPNNFVMRALAYNANATLISL
jgi:hypothetical protein